MAAAAGPQKAVYDSSPHPVDIAGPYVGDLKGAQAWDFRLLFFAEIKPK